MIIIEPWTFDIFSSSFTLGAYSARTFSVKVVSLSLQIEQYVTCCFWFILILFDIFLYWSYFSRCIYSFYCCCLWLYRYIPQELLCFVGVFMGLLMFSFRPSFYCSFSFSLSYVWKYKPYPGELLRVITFRYISSVMKFPIYS